MVEGRAGDKLVLSALELSMISEWFGEWLLNLLQEKFCSGMLWMRRVVANEGGSGPHSYLIW